MRLLSLPTRVSAGSPALAACLALTVCPAPSPNHGGPGSPCRRALDPGGRSVDSLNHAAACGPPPSASTSTPHDPGRRWPGSPIGEEDVVEDQEPRHESHAVGHEEGHGIEEHHLF